MYRLVLLFAALAGCVDSGEDITLENSSDGGKADSVAGKRITVTITDTQVVTSGPAGCSRGGDGPWVCGGNEAWGHVDVFVNGDTVGLRGQRAMPATRESFYVFEAAHEGFGLPNYRNVTYGQLLYVRKQGVTRGGDEWSMLHCAQMNYFSNRVTVDLTRRTVQDAGSGIESALDSCGAPAGDLEVGSFAFPVSRWFSLEGGYDYHLGINKP